MEGVVPHGAGGRVQVAEQQIILWLMPVPEETSQNTRCFMTPGSLIRMLVHIVQNFGIHNVVYKRQAWGIAPCFYLPSRS